jgi:aminoglycoside phosphotransferase (APT) family kinase protein
MVTAADPRSSFAFLSTGHAMSPEVRELLGRVTADPLLVAGAPDAVGPVSIRRELRVEPDRAGRWEVRRFYWSATWREPGPTARFRARTLLYEPSRGEPRTHDFPDDPWLPAAGARGGPLDDAGVEVLRYIPTRRITFRRGDGLVGKVKRARTLERSYRLLCAVHAAARSAGVAVPAPMGLDPARGAFYQERMPGRPMDELIGPANAAALMGALGVLHGAIHALPAQGVAARSTADVVAAVRADAAWLAFALADEAGAVAELERRVVAEVEALGAGAPRLCHGDPAMDQVLVDGASLAIVDFDDAALGDPYADLGTMIAGMALDAPLLFGGDRSAGEPAVTAYLDGYRERTGRAVDERRLRAHRLRAELALLANRLRKGRMDADGAARALVALRDG